MKYAYQVLLNVTFNHTYFSDGIFRSLSVEPTAATHKLLLNNGLLFKAYSGGFRILFETDSNGSNRTRESYLKDNLSCSFKLSLNDKSFYNYTALEPSDISKSIFYFSNILAGNESLRDSLHTGEFVATKDLRALNENTEQYFTKPFAILDLTLSSELPELYSLKFKAKETIWRYILLGDDLKSLDKPAVIDHTGTDLFDGPQKLQFHGNEGIAFSSKTPISFSEKSIHNFQLVENYDSETGRYKVLMRALPHANPALITLIDNNDLENNNYSEIFIN